MYTYNLIFFMLSCVKNKKKNYLYIFYYYFQIACISFSLSTLKVAHLALPCPKCIYKYIIWIIYSYNLIISMHILVIIFFIHILLWFPKYLYLIISY